MKARSFGFAVGLLILASACAHGFLGWPLFRGRLQTAGVEPDVVAALAAGWYSGSASMLAFGGIVLQQAVRQPTGMAVQPGPLWVVAAAYLAFGSLAFVLRDLNPHFLAFVVTGVLVGWFNHLSCRDSPSLGQESRA
jgi:hypothetical protein